MGRLIDADDLKYQMFGEGYQTKWTNEQIADAIDNQPTAYDVDKVIEQLEDYGKHKGLLRITDNPTNCDNYVPVREVKKIVKGAVKNEYISSNNYNSISNNPNN